MNKFDALTAQLQTAQELIEGLQLGCAAEVAVEGGVLRFGKMNKGWLLQWVAGDSADAQPLAKMSVRIRVLCASHLPELLEALDRAALVQTAAIDTAIALVSKFNEDLRRRTDETE